MEYQNVVVGTGKLWNKSSMSFLWNLFHLQFQTTPSKLQLIITTISYNFYLTSVSGPTSLMKKILTRFQNFQI